MRIPEYMNAAWIDELGPAENIRYGQLPVPQPGPTDVLVRVAACAVNPVDTFIRAGKYRTPMAFPFILGRDVVGTVAAVGSGSSPFTVGDQVWCNSLGHGGRQGAAAEYAVVSADRLYSLPDNVDPITAVAVVHPGATAHLAIAVYAKIHPGETVCVVGGGGNVGSAATVMAVQAGAQVIVTASAKDSDYCRSLGADTVVDYTTDNVESRIRDAAPNGVDVYMDTSGRDDLTQALNLLAFRGRIIVMSGINAHPEIPIGSLYTEDRQIIGFDISDECVCKLTEAAQHLNQLLTNKTLAPHGVEKLPLNKASEAHKRLEEGQLHGKRLVLCP